jgi:starvation-inducible DNA-binding protein
MEELKLSLKIALANTFVMYYKAQSYHWNVEGINFSQYHDFFGDIYQEVYGSVDSMAEELRALNEFAPHSLMDLYTYKTVQEDETLPTSVVDMLSSLQVANQEVIDSLNNLFKKSNEQNEQGLADLAAARLDAHKKHAWMIRSSLK